MPRKTIRRILFYSFVCLFLITTSSVLLHAFGYRFSAERGIFIYTGSVTIKSRPESVTIRVDGEIVPQQNLGLINDSLHIAGLRPKEYFLEVSAAGYRPWNKKIAVQSGRSTEFWNVLLVKEDYAPEIIPSSENAVKMFPAPKAELYAIVKQRENEISLDTWNTKDTQSRQVLSIPEATFDKDSEENLEWSPESHKLLIPYTQKDRSVHGIVSLETATFITLENLATTETVHNPRWDPTAENRIFYVSNGSLYRLDTEEFGAKPVFLAEHIATYDLSGNFLYYVSSVNGLVYRFPAGESAPQPTQITLTPMEFLDNRSSALVVYDEDHLAFYEHGGKLFVFNRQAKQPVRELAMNVKGVQFSDDGKKLLFFTDNEISVYFTRDWDVQPAREADSTIQVARFSNPIRNVQWTEDYEHILFSGNSSLKVIELDHRDRRNIADIMSFLSPPLQVLSSFQENRMYVVRKNDDHRDVIMFDFPEKTGFFGL